MTATTGHNLDRVLLALHDHAGEASEIARRAGLDLPSTVAALTVSEIHGWAMQQRDGRRIVWKERHTC